MTAATELATLVAPLVEAFGSPERAERLLRELGVLTTPSTPVAVPPALADLATAAQDTLDALADIDDKDIPLAQRGVTLGQSMVELFDAIGALATVDVADLGAPYDDTTLWPLLARSLPSYLFMRWLRDNHRTGLDALALLAVITQPTTGAPIVDLQRLIDVAGDPSAALATIPVGDLVAPLRRLLDAKGVTSNVDAIVVGEDSIAWAGSGLPDPARLALTFPVGAGLPGPALAIEAVDDNASISVDGTGEVDLGGGWALAVPGEDGDALSLTAAPAMPWALLGGAGTTRVELAGASIGVAAGAVAADVGITLATAGLRLVLVPGDADAFVARLLGAGEVAADMPFTAVWSPVAGFTVEGGAGLAVRITTSIAIGPINIVGLVIGLDVTLDRVALLLTCAVNAVIGPIAAVVDGIGLQFALRAAPDPGSEPALGVPLGPIAAELALQPPHGIGLGIDAGVVAGGGYLYLDEDAGTYSGVVDVEMFATSISAVGIIDTRAPGVDGWSMFFALFLGLPAIQLGFGFTLTGVGGLAGINRTVDTAALDAAIRGGGLDSVLFPDDPVASAPVIIAALRDIFPPANNQYVFGPVARIGWGTPSLITTTVGIVVTLPDPVVVAVLGTVTSVLPTSDLDLVSLHLDVAGVIDVTDGTLAVDASLHDSYIAYYALSGDMALRASFGAAPTFLMALGGFYPGFTPPGGFPALERLSLAVSAAPVIDVHFSCYLALTSNTVQFGAEFGLTAEVDGFGIAGDTEFDALVFFHPFQLTTHLGFHVEVTGDGVDLAGIWLDVYVTGPNPWHVIGDATIKVLGVSIPLHLNEVIGAHRDEPPVAAADLREEIIDALADPDAWVAMTGGSPGVLLTAAPAEGSITSGDAPSVPATPDGTVSVAQQAAPLDIALDKAGERTLARYNMFHLEASDGSLAVSGEVTDWFPPGFFFDIPADEQVTSPSFEQLIAGARFGGGDPVAGRDRTTSLAFKQILRDPVLAEDRVKPGIFHLDADPRAGIATSLTAAVARPAAFAGAAFAHSAPLDSAFPVEPDGSPITCAAPSYAVADALTGDVRLTAASWSAARHSEAGRAATNTVVPSWEVPT